jgi:hypothetical protein
MSKRAKEKRVSPYRQRDINPLGGLAIIGNLFEQAENKLPLGDEQVTDIGITSWHAFSKMVSGTAPDADDWAMIASSLNIALMLAEDGYGIEHQDQFNRALEGISRAWVRGSRTGQWRFDGPAIQDVRDALELHDQQCALVTKGDIKRALLEVTARINAGHVYEIEVAA